MCKTRFLKVAEDEVIQLDGGDGGHARASAGGDSMAVASCCCCYRCVCMSFRERERGEEREEREEREKREKREKEEAFPFLLP